MKLSKVYKAKTYEEAQKKCPKGYRIPKLWEVMKLGEEKHKKIMKTEEGSWIFFWSSSEHLGEQGVLIRDWYSDLGARYWDLVYSDADGRVVYVKEEEHEPE